MEKSSSAIVVSKPETKKFNEKEMYRPWSELADLIIEKIYGGLEFLDKFRTASVCVSWRNAAPEFARRRPQKLVPWLILSYDVQTEALGLLNFHENMIHHIRIPHINMKLCCGSSQGWLFMFDDAQYNHCFLLNPITKARIHLPPLNIELLPHDVVKVILSSDPKISEEWIVVACVASRGLIFYKSTFMSWSFASPEDRLWYPLDDRDIVIYGRRVYALEILHSLSIYDMDHLICILEGSAVSPFYDLHHTTDPYISYLVESNGEIFLIARFFKNIRNPCTACDSLSFGECFECQSASFHYVTLKFLLFKLKLNYDERRKRTDYVWVKQSSLGVDQALFLSKSGSISISTIESPGVHGDSVYFTNDLHPETGKLFDRGIYHIQDGQCEPLIQIDSYPSDFPSVWITPSI
ncbi:uncharacterized protein LOC122059839 [Macadamia integrifolia]|uniref:uncharacterized protein LOC122059839 n=1 Tax=Macadamia integrifolia TaxID=60698 RepID=UPI001C528264|nr:uncharacterized protein LOC122059839 [Macadamia integrifolia]